MTPRYQTVEDANEWIHLLDALLRGDAASLDARLDAHPQCRTLIPPNVHFGTWERDSQTFATLVLPDLPVVRLSAELRGVDTACSFGPARRAVSPVPLDDLLAQPEVRWLTSGRRSPMAASRAPDGRASSPS